VLRRTISTLAQTKGSVKDVQGILGHSKSDTTVNVYMQPIGKREPDAGSDLLRVDGTAEAGGGIVKSKNLVRFGTVGVWGGPQVIVPLGLGA
jgi:hypothetical protein